MLGKQGTRRQWTRPAGDRGQVDTAPQHEMQIVHPVTSAVIGALTLRQS